MRNAAFAAFASMIAFGAASVAVGQSNNADAPCWKRGGTFAIADCFAASGKTSDAELNRIYLQIMSVLEADDRQRLQRAERLWLAYRDAFCDAEYSLWEGGTGGPPAKLACIDTETRRHLDLLRSTYRLRLQRFGR